MITPIEIKVIDKKDLLIKWNDEKETNISLRKLREFCPCATCISLRDKQGKNYIPIFHEAQTSVAGIQTVGSYAVTISWQDGHNTGIYEFPFLRNLSK